MENSSPEWQVDEVLRAIQRELRNVVAARLAGGEIVGRAQGDEIIASRPATRNLTARRKELIAELAGERVASEAMERKSVA